MSEGDSGLDAPSARVVVEALSAEARDAVVANAVRSPDVVDAVAPKAKAKPERRRGATKKPNSGNHRLARKPEIESMKRAATYEALRSGREMPLEVVLDTMDRYVGEARILEDEPVMTAELRSEARACRALAMAAAQAALPFLHAKLAPIVAKGEKGLVVNLVIEDA